ncbi:MAG: L,D-transpeptidase, partial [Spirochaetia bacterium]
WAGEASPEGPVSIVISLPLQRAQVYRNGILIGVSSVSTGKPGHETPTGLFTILQKDRVHHSNLYNDASMPFMRRLTWDGIALHAGRLPGHPASHGCIRLPDAFAEKLFAVTKLGISVVVTASRNLPRITPDMVADGTVLAHSAEVAGEVVWRPWLQREGPLSIVVSSRDRQIRVVRNGVEIGRAPVRLRREVTGTELYTLTSMEEESDRYDWVRVPLADDEESVAVTSEERNNLSLPSDFRALLARELRPGTMVVVSSDSLENGGFDRRIQIVEPANRESTDSDASE